MQAAIYKISLLFWFVLGQIGTAGAGSLDRADSLFRAGAVSDAVSLYETAIATGQAATDPMLLKLAYAYEQQNDIPRLLYYLQVYFERHPNEAVLRKMNDIARAHGLVGYETDDLNYFYLFYKQYGTYLLLFGLGLGMYVVTVLLLKTQRKEQSPTRYKWVILLYLLGLLVFANLPEGYQSGITSRDRVYLRSEPSAAAAVIDVIGRGHKVNILGSEDIWLRVFWNNQLYYVRRDAVWLI
ncbi:MAG: SH3 domain-containing protein [Bacteroidetes bacterium]|nr:SH3 domain-containing protein [Fibrella sp.]